MNLHPVPLLLLQPGETCPSVSPRGGQGIRVTAGYATVAVEETEGSAQAALDMEVGRLALEYSRALGRATELRVTVPWLWMSRGAFDPFLIGYHDALGLPGGDRKGRPENEYEYTIRRGASVYDPRPPPAGGLGDVQVEVIRRFAEGEGGAVRWGGRLSLKLPTGDEGEGLGSGHADAGVGIVGSAQRGRFSGEASADAIYVGGSPDPALRLGSHAMLRALAGAFLQIGHHWDLGATILFASSPWDTGISSLDGEVLMLSAGLRGGKGEGLRWAFGFCEDLKVETSPDFTLFASLAWQWGNVQEPPRTGE